MYWASDESKDYTEEKLHELVWGIQAAGRITCTARLGDRCLDFIIHTGMKHTCMKLDGLTLWIPRHRLTRDENRRINQHIIDEFDKPENISGLY